MENRAGAGSLNPFDVRAMFRTMEKEQAEHKEAVSIPLMSGQCFEHWNQRNYGVSMGLNPFDVRAMFRTVKTRRSRERCRRLNPFDVRAMFRTYLEMKSRADGLNPFDVRAMFRTFNPAHAGVIQAVSIPLMSGQCFELLSLFFDYKLLTCKDVSRLFDGPECQWTVDVKQSSLK